LDGVRPAARHRAALNSAVSFNSGRRAAGTIAAMPETTVPNIKGASIMSNRLTSIAAAAAVAILATACAAPKDLDLSLRHASAQGRFLVEMQPPATAPAINQMHAWQVKLATPDGQPVSKATIAFDGGMPQHGHGFPTKPRVTRELQPGVYALEGMKFSMTGWWDMRLAIEAGGVADTAVFNVIVENGGIKSEVR
jgi:hypothetical protein